MSDLQLFWSGEPAFIRNKTHIKTYRRKAKIGNKLFFVGTFEFGE